MSSTAEACPRKLLINDRIVRLNVSTTAAEAE
jgi:hypothetical protein